MTFYQMQVIFFYQRNVGAALFMLKDNLNIKVGTVKIEKTQNNFKGTYQRFLSSDNFSHFFRSVKRTAAHWQQLLYDVLFMIKELGIPTSFFTLSCVDLKWKERLPYITKEFENLDLSDEKVSVM